MKPNLLFFLILFQSQIHQTKIVGGDNYPIEKWRILVFLDDGETRNFKSNLKGEVIFADTIFNKYRNKRVQVIFDQKGMVKKLYKIPEELEGELSLEELMSNQVYKLKNRF